MKTLIKHLISIAEIKTQISNNKQLKIKNSPENSALPYKESTIFFDYKFLREIQHVIRDTKYVIEPHPSPAKPTTGERESNWSKKKLRFRILRRSTHGKS